MSNTKIVKRTIDTVRPPSSREEDRQQLLFCPHYLARIEQIRLRDSEVYLADFRRLASGLDPIYDDEHRRRDFVSVHCDQVTAYNPAPVVLRPLPLASRDAASISWAGSSTVAAAVSCTVVPSRRSVTPASPTGSAQPSSTTQRRKPSCQTSGSYTQQLDAATPGLLQSTGTHTSPPREGASACI